MIISFPGTCSLTLTVMAISVAGSGTSYTGPWTVRTHTVQGSRPFPQGSKYPNLEYIPKILITARTTGTLQVWVLWTLRVRAVSYRKAAYCASGVVLGSHSEGSTAKQASEGGDACIMSMHTPSASTSPQTSYSRVKLRRPHISDIILEVLWMMRDTEEVSKNQGPNKRTHCKAFIIRIAAERTPQFSQKLQYYLGQKPFVRLRNVYKYEHLHHECRSHLPFQTAHGCICIYLHVYGCFGGFHAQGHYPGFFKAHPSWKPRGAPYSFGAMYTRSISKTRQQGVHWGFVTQRVQVPYYYYYYYYYYYCYYYYYYYYYYFFLLLL